MNTSFPDLHTLLRSTPAQMYSSPKFTECNDFHFKKCMANPNSTVEHCKNICSSHLYKEQNWGLPRCDVTKNSLKWYKSAYKNCTTGDVSENCCNEITCSNPSVVNKKC